MGHAIGSACDIVVTANVSHSDSAAKRQSGTLRAGSRLTIDLTTGDDTPALLAALTVEASSTLVGTITVQECGAGAGCLTQRSVALAGASSLVTVPPGRSCGNRIRVQVDEGILDIRSVLVLPQESSCSAATERPSATSSLCWESGTSCQSCAAVGPECASCSVGEDVLCFDSESAAFSAVCTDVEVEPVSDATECAVSDDVTSAEVGDRGADTDDTLVYVGVAVAGGVLCCLCLLAAILVACRRQAVVVTVSQRESAPARAGTLSPRGLSAKRPSVASTNTVLVDGVPRVQYGDIPKFRETNALPLASYATPPRDPSAVDSCDVSVASTAYGSMPSRPPYQAAPPNYAELSLSSGTSRMDVEPGYGPVIAPPFGGLARYDTVAPEVDDASSSTTQSGEAASRTLSPRVGTIRRASGGGTVRRSSAGQERERMLRATSKSNMVDVKGTRRRSGDRDEGPSVRRASSSRRRKRRPTPPEFDTAPEIRRPNRDPKAAEVAGFLQEEME